VTLLKSTVQLFIPVGALLMVIQLPVIGVQLHGEAVQDKPEQEQACVWDDELGTCMGIGIGAAG